MRGLPLRALRIALVLGAGGSVLAGLPAAHAETVIYDRGAEVERLLAVPGGLLPGDGLIQQQPARRGLPGDRQAWKVSGSVGTRATPALAGRGPGGMAALLRDRIRRSGAHLVFLDELGPAFRERQGDDLAEALGILAKETADYAPEGLARRVHLYLPAPGPLLSDQKPWTGARAAVAEAGGVWLEAYRGRDQWTAEEWLAWPGEAARQMKSLGGSPRRLHVLLRGGGDHGRTWDLARTGGACEVLANGPGAYRLGADAARFAAEYRRTFPTVSAVTRPVDCTPAASLPIAASRSLVAATAREATGLELPEGGVLTPPLPAGQPAQVTVRVGADPLGLAAALGVAPERLWSLAGARVEATGPGVAAAAPIDGEGAARLAFVPAAPGPVSLRLMLPGAAVAAATGAPVDLLASLRAADAGPDLIGRVVNEPSRWALAVPLLSGGAAPIQIVPAG